MEFNVQINKFQTLGTYDYKFDEVGNVIANSSSAEFSYNYLSLPLLDVVYDNSSIESYYSVTFEEFISSDKVDAGQQIVSENLSQKNDDLKQENEQLREQLNNLINTSEDDSSVAQKDAIKQVIIDLRIKLGEGKEEKDFNEEFPYTVKKVE